mgnify:CR=1 FL=1
MAREKRVVLILVEGPSDENALLEPMQAALDLAADGASPEARSLAFHCDVTTVLPFTWETSFTVKERVRDTVRQFVIDRIATRHEYEWTDLDRIIHIVDLDGAFIPNERIVEGRCEGFTYGCDSIIAKNISEVIDRNARKSDAMLELAGTRELKHRKRAVPYSVYFMSRNLEHALYGSAREFSDEEKKRLSAAFGKKYRNDPKGFIELLQSEEVKVPGDTVKETWCYAQQSTNSLHRGSNLHLFFSSFEPESSPRPSAP